MTKEITFYRAILLHKCLKPHDLEQIKNDIFAMSKTKFARRTGESRYPD